MSSPSSAALHLPSIEAFARELAAMGEPSGTVALRASVPRALRASGLLTMTSAAAAPPAPDALRLELSLWGSLLVALDSEDAGTRTAAAAVAAEICGLGSVHETLVLRSVLPHLSALRGALPQYHVWLSALIDPASDAAPIDPAAGPAAPPAPAPSAARGEGVPEGASADAEVTLRVFQREVDNPHAEPLLLAQLAARELSHLSVSLELREALAARGRRLLSLATEQVDVLERCSPKWGSGAGQLEHLFSIAARGALLLRASGEADAASSSAVDHRIHLAARHPSFLFDA